MALHTSLPIYKVCYDLAGLAVELIRQMPRDVKHVIGAELRDGCLLLVVMVFRANVALKYHEKVPHLTDLLERLQVIELLLRLAQDKKFISRAQYARAIALTGSIGKQANGWRSASAAAPVA